MLCFPNFIQCCEWNSSPSSLPGGIWNVETPPRKAFSLETKCSVCSAPLHLSLCWAPESVAGVGSQTGNLLSRMRENLYAEVLTPHFFVSKNFPAKTTVWRTFRSTRLFSCPCKLSLEIALCYWAYNASSGLSLATLTPTSDTKMMDCLIFMLQVVRRKGKDQRFSTQNTLVLQLHSNQLSKLYFPIHSLATLRQDK